MAGRDKTGIRLWLRKGEQPCPQPPPRPHPHPLAQAAGLVIPAGLGGTSGGGRAPPPGQVEAELGSGPVVRTSSLGPRKAGPGRGWLGPLRGEQRKLPEVASLGRGPTEGMGDWPGPRPAPAGERATSWKGEGPSGLGPGAARPVPRQARARHRRRLALHATSVTSTGQRLGLMPVTWSFQTRRTHPGGTRLARLAQRGSDAIGYLPRPEQR